MPFKKGEGGRPRGAGNRATREVKDIFIRLGGPDGALYAQQLHDLATGKHGDPHVRIKALSVIAPYVWRKLAERIELTGVNGGPIEVHDHFAIAGR